jgi:CRP-like cAMP-binding protein
VTAAVSEVSASSSSNRLLARLPHDEYQRLRQDLEPITVHSKRILLKPQELSGAVYFLEGGVCSLTQATADGQVAGVGVVGNEGLIGMTEFGGDPESGVTAIVEIADGDALAMDVRAFRRELERRKNFSDLVHRYARAFTCALMQSITCNALHSIERRCARCLLDIRDRVGRSELPVTHDTLAEMLGVRRASITLAAGALQRAQLIDHSHKRIAITDSAGLEATSCECYAAVKRHYDRLFV